MKSVSNPYYTVHHKDFDVVMYRTPCNECVHVATVYKRGKLLKDMLISFEMSNVPLSSVKQISDLYSHIPVR